MLPMLFIRAHNCVCVIEEMRYVVTLEKCAINVMGVYMHTYIWINMESSSFRMCLHAPSYI